MGPTSFFWFDFETTGTDPVRDRPIQFAGIRTGLNFNPIGEPIMFYCRLAKDVLPQPEACLLTGITPQYVNREGLCEAELMQVVEEQLSQPGTCALGYNTIRFDDEVVRHGFYRNFIDPYAREWQNHCSRWDIIDLVRMTYAMRPEGIVWPKGEDDKVSMKLEALTKANNITHEQAHDALSDVYGTIEIAKLIREKQPKLFDYYLKMRQKHELQQFIDPIRMKPFLYISDMFNQACKYSAFVVPIVPHPTNKNGVIIYDLMADAQPLLDLSVEEIRHRVFTRQKELDEITQLPLKVIYYNKSPAVAPATFLKDKFVVERLALDGDICCRNLELLKKQSNLMEKISAVFIQKEHTVSNDPDLMLYSGGFFSREDRVRMEIIRTTPPGALNELEMLFDDCRLPEMLIRYIGRNYPSYLSEQQRSEWEEYRMIRLMENDGNGSITMSAYFERLNTIALSDQNLTSTKQIMLKDLANYAQSICPTG